ncbi:DUF6233 domain-containing protein [Streptomyces deccanensis]|uniref:DUF6233 domain-containing protein n=1 Tax=Streptomyces deccanensis TaxID=424188 RepID=UPI0023BA821C|nr:DUF6233 domain-containing protein [Streptomyces deccanensis]
MVELGIGTGRPPVTVHAGDCYANGERSLPADRTRLRRVLAAALLACTHCRPEQHLGILDGPTADTATRPLRRRLPRSLRLRDGQHVTARPHGLDGCPTASYSGG